MERTAKNKEKFFKFGQMKIRYVILSSMVLLAFISAGFFVFLNYNNKQEALIGGLDAKLFTAATMARSILSNAFHDKIKDSSSVSDKEYINIVSQFNQLCKTLDMEYIWSLIDINGQIRFTSATSTSKTIIKGDFARFFEIHSNPELYYTVFNSMKPQFQTNDDKWGKIRVALLPFQDAYGRKYLFGASIKTAEIDLSLEKTLINTILICGMILFIVILLGLVLSFIISRPIEKITSFTKMISEGNLNKEISVTEYAEAKILSDNINYMNFAIREKIQQIKDNEENLKTTLNSIDEAVIVANSDLKIIRMNTIAEIITGYSFQNSENRKITDIISMYETDSQEKIENLFSEVIEFGKQIISHLDTSLKTRGKPDIKISYLISPISSGSNTTTGLVLVMRDITNENRLVKQIKDSEEKFFKAFHATPDAIVIAGIPDGKIIEVNDMFYQLSGYTREESIGKTTIDLNLWLNLEDRQKLLSSMLGSGIIREHEMLFRIKTGELIECTISMDKIALGSQTCTLAIIRDITKRKNAERTLKQSEERFRELFDRAPVGYHEIDINAKIVQINKTEIEMLGYEEHDMINHYVWEFICEQEISRQQTAEKLAGKLNILKPYERTFIHKNGFKIPVLVDDLILRNSENQITGIRSTIKDISDRKIAELALKETNKRLEEALIELRNTQKQVLQQERLRALGQLASGIAHDINNSLTPILGYVDILFDEPEIANKAGNELNKIYTATRDIKRTIERMKEFYRPKNDEDDLIPLNINNIIIGTIDLTRHKWKNIPESQGTVINIITDLYDNLPSIMGTESEIREALTNLIINAVDAMPEGGNLSISTSIHDNFISIEISDTGIGMDEETQKRCLEPFFSTKGDKGTGLGLSMVYGIIERHGGFVEIESEIGKGTKFKILIPKKESYQNKEIVNIITNDSSPLKILVIDDDTEVRLLVEKLLLKLNHKAMTAQSGDDGIELFKSELDSNNPFDLVITDLGMGHMDGKTLSLILKSISPKIPIILLTGWGSFIEKENYSDISVILNKPVTKMELDNAIAKCRI